jgi:hypothetical protein
MVSAAIEDFWQAKRGAGRSSVYLKEIRYRLGTFARAFNLEVRELVAQDVADYLEGLQLPAVSTTNSRCGGHSFASVRRGGGFRNRPTCFHVSNGGQWALSSYRGNCGLFCCASSTLWDMPRHPSARWRAHRGTFTAHVARLRRLLKCPRMSVTSAHPRAVQEAFWGF